MAGEASGKTSWAKPSNETQDGPLLAVAQDCRFSHQASVAAAENDLDDRIVQVGARANFQDTVAGQARVELAD
jgi:hypothetical protein